jgi:hypothetical protein
VLSESHYERIRRNRHWRQSLSQALADAAQTQKEIKALETALGHADREWKKETEITPTDEEKRRLLALLDIEV